MGLIPSCLWSLRIFPSLPGSRLTVFYRDVSSAILQLVNQCSAAGDGLTNMMENPTFVPRAHYLRLLRRRRRYEPQYYSVLRLCSEFRDSRSFLPQYKKKYPPLKSMHNKNAARSGRDLIVSLKYENIPTLATQTRWQCPSFHATQV